MTTPTGEAAFVLDDVSVGRMYPKETVSTFQKQQKGKKKKLVEKTYRSPEKNMKR